MDYLHSFLLSQDAYQEFLEKMVVTDYRLSVTNSRPAKSSKWREYHLRKLLHCAEICQHKHNKTENQYAYFCRFQDVFEKSGLCGNLAVKITTKQNEDLILVPQNLLVCGNFLTVHKLFRRIINIKVIFCLISKKTYFFL